MIEFTLDRYIPVIVAPVLSLLLVLAALYRMHCPRRSKYTASSVMRVWGEQCVASGVINTVLGLHTLACAVVLCSGVWAVLDMLGGRRTTYYLSKREMDKATEMVLGINALLIITAVVAYLIAWAIGSIHV